MLQKISQLESRSGVKLGFAQKIILAETGLVEQVLSILIGSAISVQVVHQKENARTITRESLITSRVTGKTLIRAHSKIFSLRLPPKVLSQIKQKRAGIGTIIYAFGLETFRKIIEVSYDPKSRSIFRKYHIIYRGKVAFVINEELLI
jgi:chorismate-pyruvate lyase